jgi:hypothetical protein
MSRAVTASLSALRSRVRESGGTHVELTRHGACATGEAFVEDVRRSGDGVEVAVLLADGSDATARLDVGEWEWLDHRPGDIVLVRRPGWAGVSA